MAKNQWWSSVCEIGSPDGKIRGGPKVGLGVHKPYCLWGRQHLRVEDKIIIGAQVGPVPT